MHIVPGSESWLVTSLPTYELETAPRKQSIRYALPLIYGAGTLGIPGPDSNGARVHTVQDAQAIANCYIVRGYDTIDTARLYGGGTSEEFLGQMDLENSVVDTKIYPGQHGDFSDEGIKESLNRSHAALGKHKIRTFYLHFPDRTVPIETTLRAINKLYNEGHFERFGLSNYTSWQVAEIMGIATHHGWVKPTVYQGKYNAIERTVEAELLPCLRHFGIEFYAYSPLAGGVLAGNIFNQEDMAARKGGRWDPQACRLAPAIQSQYAPSLPAVRQLKEALDQHGLGLAEASYRWLQHHSTLEQGDAVIIAATSTKQLEMNMDYCEEGPLSEKVVELFEMAWLGVKSFVAHYAS